MRHFFLMLLLFAANMLTAQQAASFDKRWCYSASKVIYFEAVDSTLYARFIRQSDSARFTAFYNGTLNDTVDRMRMDFERVNGKCFIHGWLSRGRKPYFLDAIYDPKNDSTLILTGNVYYNTKRVPYTGSNCDSVVPHCSMFFFRKDALAKMKKLKSLDKISLTEAVQIMRDVQPALAQRCNRCYDAFFDSDFNLQIMRSGYNPINLHNVNGRKAYQLSGCNYIIKDLFPNEEKIKETIRDFGEPFLYGPAGKPVQVKPAGSDGAGDSGEDLN